MAGIKKETPDRKEVVWEGDSRERLQDFPNDVQNEIGLNLDRIQQGKRSPIAKHWDGQIWELRDDGSDGKTYRLVYVAIIEDEVSVLHCFDKTSAKTSKSDSKIIKSRFAEVKKRKANRPKGKSK